jgi:phosphoglucomutase
MQQAKQNAEKWLEKPFDTETQKEVSQLLKLNPTDFQDSFYKDLEFGTGGMRGIMGVGTNRLNKYTIGKATQGLSNYLNKIFVNQPIKVAIAFDVRHNSKAFAQICADVFSANNIEVLLFEDFRPTPVLSFAVRELQCHAGIVLTASHNPPEYNGYKVYWQDGAQIVPPYDKNIIQEVEKVEYDEIKFDGNPKKIQLIGDEIDQKFYQKSVEYANFNPEKNKELRIVFTPIHGTSVYAIPSVLEKAGYEQVFVVKEQAVPSGDFFTVASPNPEEPEALKMALELAIEKDADVFIGTDPDADRLGVGVKESFGKYRMLNGNETNTLLTDFLLNKWKNAGKIDGNQFIGTTNVTTDILLPMAEKYGVKCLVGLTGFKWIAKMISDNPTLKFICGGEESYGFLVDDFVRDKDAVSTALLFCEMVYELKKQGKTPLQKLKEIYVELGFYKESLLSLTKKGQDGLAEIKQIMQEFRSNPPKEIDKSEIIFVEDYLSGEIINLKTKEIKQLNFPKSDVLTFRTEDGTKISVRPSGTEPKIKFYVGVRKKIESVLFYDKTEIELKNKIDKIILLIKEKS